MGARRTEVFRQRRKRSGSFVENFRVIYTRIEFIVNKIRLFSITGAQRKSRNANKENKEDKEHLALLIARAREGRKLVQALARSALQIREYRERWYRYLSSGAGQSLAMKLE